ncbi:hypothetical protein C1645_745170 [Glomus cerebriforme]|uniref:Uncharacterized protein n=1 Tax=Glomus cerebriforme TaxID=658196 RepID=A0A397S8B1_9GLOM|nr:hypothetical protein C1645_745170 [Glomus cerebriforme]
MVKRKANSTGEESVEWIWYSQIEEILSQSKAIKPDYIIDSSISDSPNISNSKIQMTKKIVKLKNYKKKKRKTGIEEKKKLTQQYKLEKSKLEIEKLCIDENKKVKLELEMLKTKIMINNEFGWTSSGIQVSAVFFKDGGQDSAGFFKTTGMLEFSLDFSWTLQDGVTFGWVLQDYRNILLTFHYFFFVNFEEIRFGIPGNWNGFGLDDVDETFFNISFISFL